MNMPTEDIKDMLVEAGIGLIFAQNLFIGQEPVAPDNTVTLFDGPGAAPVLTMDYGSQMDQPSINIRVRNSSYPAAMALAYTMYAFLSGRSNTAKNGAFYGLIQPIDTPMLIDWDDNNRARVVFNIETKRRPNT